MTIGGSRLASLAGLFVVSLGASLALMDLAVNVAFPAMTAAFALETRSIRWVVICYVLTYSSLMLAFGKLGDRIGHRRIFRAGLIVSMLAFVLCGLAPDYPSLLGARVVQGIATALVLSCAPALATSLFDETRRVRALGGYASLTAIATVAAPLIGGASIAAMGWSGVFWFRAPLAIAALLLLPLLPQAPRCAAAADGGAANLAGSILLAATLAFLLLAPALMGLDGFGALALLSAVIGLAAFAAFVRHERRAHDPVLPIGLMRDPDFVLPNVAAIAVYFVAFAVPLLVPYYLTRIAGYAALESGAVLALSPAGALVGSALAARTVERIGVRTTAWLGGGLVAAGTLAIALSTKMPGLALIAASLVLNGAGIGLFQVAYADIVVAALPRGERGVAGSLTIVTRTIGVMTAATALTALLHLIESRARAAGAAEGAAFTDAFFSVFLYSGVMLGAFFTLTAVRRRSRPGG